MAGRSRATGRPRRWPKLIGSAVFGVSLLFLGWQVAGGAQPGEQRCGSHQSGGGSLPTGEHPAIVKIDPDEQHPFSFGRRRTQRAFDLRPDIVGVGPPAETLVAFDVQQFVDADGDATLPLDQVVVRKIMVSNNGKNLEVEVCIDPAQPEPVAAGSYTGSIVIDDPAFEAAELEMTVVLKHTSQLLPLGVAVLVGIGAAAFQWAVSGFGDPTGTAKAKSAPRRFGLSPRRLELLVGAGAGLIAALGVYGAHYEADPAWTVDFTHLKGLVATSAAAAAASYATATAFIKRKAGEQATDRISANRGPD